MAQPMARAKMLTSTWSRKPTRAAAQALRIFYGRQARKLPLAARATLCLALGEAAELEGRLDHARWLYSSAVGACNPQSDEQLYTRAAIRALLNASRLGDGATLAGVASVLERHAGAGVTARLACLGSFARGLDHLLREDFNGARRAFEAAMGAAWESHDADGEALAHHLLAQAWSRLDKMARAREHAKAACDAAKKAGSRLLELRLLLEDVMYRLRAGLTPETLAEARRLAGLVRNLGFPRFEALAWTKIARGILVDRLSARTLLTRSEGLLPEGHPDRGFVHALQSALSRKAMNGFAADASVTRELDALVALARR